MMRLDKFLVETHKATRSEAKQMAKKGLITLNGETVRKTDIKIDENTDIIAVNQEVINYKQFEYYMLNKPSGVVSATRDNIDKTVIDLISSPNKDLFPVGRLDKDTEGLLLITDDGNLAHELLSPKKHVDKKYYAKIEGIVTEETVNAFEKGVTIDGDYITKPAKLEIINSSDISEVLVTIREGKFHQIKKMFLSQNMKVLYLKRLSMKNLILDSNLKSGCYRELTKEEIIDLKN
ncbi:MAG: rRNA pseudouridine synthase [Lachnospiraceae bacterium]|nr:rRNA pseudouridine synthase [Lachnospiraceae bacterium]